MEMEHINAENIDNHEYIEGGYIDTHAHIDGPEFADDRDEMIHRAKAAGVRAILVPSIDVATVGSVLDVCRQYEGYAFPMAGLHPEEVKADYKKSLRRIHNILISVGYVTKSDSPMKSNDNLNIQSLSIDNSETSSDNNQAVSPKDYPPFIAIGEVGIDYYWSREFAEEQLDAFEQQVRWSVETRLPLMIHCRKAQNEMVKILQKYAPQLPGGIFHCFTGNEREASELLQFSGFMLGIGGVLTFKKSHLPQTLASAVPLERIVLETDSPYMAPVPMRGKRNESAFTLHVLHRLAECYGVSCQHVADVTNANVRTVFGL